jgi:endonuclease-3
MLLLSSMTHLNERKICNALKKYGKMITKKAKKEAPRSEDRLQPMEFFYGVIFDQGISADRAWEAPEKLKQRLGHLDPYKIAGMAEEKLERKIFVAGKSLHRYRKIANWLIESSKLLISRYGGDPKKIWNDNPRSDDLQRRFEEFKGIGQKKASMAANILVRDYGVPVRKIDYRGIDVSGDVHVRRVFLRTNLVERDDVDAIVKVARRLNPQYPGELDLPAWSIGRDFCRPTNPDCSRCPLTSVCPKMVSRNAQGA